MAFLLSGETFADVPQGSVLGSLFSIKHFSDLYLMVKDKAVCNFVDDTALYTNDDELQMLWIGWKMTLLFYQTSFKKTFLSLKKIKSTLSYLAHSRMA